MQYERRLEFNEWIIATRWFYMVAVFLIGILGNSLISIFSIRLTFLYIGILLIIFLIINYYFYLLLSKVKKLKSDKGLKYLSIAQIGLELIVFTAIMFLLGEKTIASVFFFLPIISASFIFGVRGSIITALISAALINIPALTEYINYVIIEIFSRDILNKFELMELQFRTVSLVKTIVTSNFYLVMAIFSGYSSKLLFTREKRLMSQTEKLSLAKKLGDDELKKLDYDARLLSRKESELVRINEEIKKKLFELKISEKSMMRAFSDLNRERRRTEDERDRTVAIISNFIDPIIVINKYSRISLINPAAKSMFGLLDSDLEVKISDENNHSMINFHNIIKRDYEVKPGENQMEEEMAINYAGQEVTYKVITAKVDSKNHKYLGKMKIFYNLTREKMIDRLKSEFISIAAHQLRTPLSAIKWVIKMVLDGDVGKLNIEQEKLLFKGYQSNERIIGLVNDMLNVSRIDEGRFGYNFKMDDFEDVLNIVVDSLDNLIKEKKINFIINKPDKLPKIYFDAKKMDLVLQNILENAVKYTPELGKIEVTLEVAGHKFLKVRIKDNGVGIPKSDQAKLFSKFFRANNVIRMQTEGSGLGLFIVKNVIKKHGGDITFESKEGIGTEFVFTLPLNKIVDPIAI